MNFFKPLYGKLHLGQPMGINFRKLVEDIEAFPTRLLLTFSTFKFNNLSLHYQTNDYNNTHLNERAVEMPIVKHLINNWFHELKDYELPMTYILELGNVTSHYPNLLPETKCFSHRVIVDKYESGPNVNNIDIMKFQSNRKYDLIISISTLEHVGVDEDEVNETKAVLALEKLISLITATGKLIFTIPAGHNPTLDNYILTAVKNASFGNNLTHQLFFFKRISASNLWQQCTSKDFAAAQYNSPFPFANVICVGVISHLKVDVLRT